MKLRGRKGSLLSRWCVDPGRRGGWLHRVKICFSVHLPSFSLKVLYIEPVFHRCIPPIGHTTKFHLLAAVSCNCILLGKLTLETKHAAQMQHAPTWPWAIKVKTCGPGTQHSTTCAPSPAQSFRLCPAMQRAHALQSRPTLLRLAFGLRIYRTKAM